MSYRTILLDPPWRERGGGKIKRGADRHYPLLSTDKILETILTSGVFEPAKSCHLYLWVTNNFLEDGLWLMGELCFRYITMRTWAKDRIGLGQYFRGQTEHVLFGVLGDHLPYKAKNQSTLIGKGLVPKTLMHSRKPEVQYEEIEAVSPGPYLEMFATDTRRGWDSWGTFDGAKKPARLLRTDKRGVPRSA